MGASQVGTGIPGRENMRRAVRPMPAAAVASMGAVMRLEMQARKQHKPRSSNTTLDKNPWYISLHEKNSPVWQNLSEAKLQRKRQTGKIFKQYILERANIPSM